MTTWIKVGFFIFFYIIIYFFYVGLTTRPTEGDSLMYHIPIAQSILSGEFLHPNYQLTYSDKAWDHMYFPAASELILAVFMVLHIPLNLYNVLATVCLFITAYFVGIRWQLKNSYATLFALTLCTLPTISRWMSAQTVDIWLAVFFMWSLGLLQKPQKTLRYFVLLGIALGMLFGTKYSGSSFAVVLLLFYTKPLYKVLNFRRFISFFIPFLLFGLFWLIRNYIFEGNPIYPQKLFGLPGETFTQWYVWQAYLHYPIDMLNAMFLEFRIWSFVLLVPFIALYVYFRNRRQIRDFPIRLIFIGVINFLLYLFFPNAPESNIHISNYRLAYAAYIPLMLVVFLLAQKRNKMELLAMVSVGNMIMLPLFIFLPKLVLIYIPAALLFFRTKVFKRMTK